MPLEIKITISDETLAAVRLYCDFLGITPEQCAAAAITDGFCNDTVVETAILSMELESIVHESREAAEAVATRYWREYATQWQQALRLRYRDGSEIKQHSFLSPHPMPPHIVGPNGGITFIDSDTTAAAGWHPAKFGAS